MTRSVQVPPTPTCSVPASEVQPGQIEVAAAWAAPPGGVLHGGEIVLLAVKPSIWRPILESGRWLVVASGLALLMLGFGWSILGVAAMTWAQALLLVGLARLAIEIVRWVPTWYLLTNHRIIRLAGVRSVRIRSIVLLDVRNTYVQKSLPERAVGVGTIMLVSTLEGDPPMIWRSVSGAEEVHARIRRAIENAIDTSHGA